MASLFDFLDPPKRDSGPLANDTWRPDPPPSLTGVHEICLNVEASGLKWFEGDLPIAISIHTGSRSYYLPWGHSGAGNLDEAVVKEWARRELRGKRITNINTRFDIHMMREWGVDLEAQDNEVSDVGHYVALLDNNRLHMNLDSLVRDYLGEEPMARLDESKMTSYTAGLAAPRAMYNVDVVYRLKQKLWPMLDKNDLQRVRALEDKVIYVVCEMEKNGTLINHELLEQWIAESLKKYHQALMDIYKQTGLKVNPNSAPDVAKLYRHFNIHISELTATGRPSFTDEVLKHEKHPAVKLVRHAKKLGSLHSKLQKYRDSVDSHGILRYALHQLRAAKSEGDDGGESGTINGRFTSTAIADGVGINIQQVLKPEKQLLSFGDEFFIRDLHIPAKGTLFLSADAEQIQYRLAAGKAGNPRVLAEYAEDPWKSFHKMVWRILKETKPDLTYKRTKDVNFAKLFAAGVTKIALMLEFITKREFEEFRNNKIPRTHPKLAKTVEILKVYKKEFPEIDQMIREASEEAKELGYVTSLLGRRMSFEDGKRLHKALNSIIMASEADIVKTKIVELHEVAKSIGYLERFQVHDEVDGDAADESTAEAVGKLLNTQSFPELKIPILWGVKTGTSWGDCAGDELAKLRGEMHL